MLLFDVGANRGDATLAGLEKGYKVIALEPGRTFNQLVKNFIYNPNVIPLKVAVSDESNKKISFYECEEDGLSTTNIDWLTKETMPYAGKPYWETTAMTVTIDELARAYGEPDLIKVDVEGAEWAVFRGMTRKYGTLSFEWTDATWDEHEKQIDYLLGLGYKEIALQFIEHHLTEPEEWFIFGSHKALRDYRDAKATEWTKDGWKKSGLRPTADVGMLSLR